MKTMMKHPVMFVALAAIGLVCNSIPAEAQTPREYADRIMKRTKSRQAGGGHTADAFAPLPSRIVALADRMKGQRIDRGECTDFVSKVLQLTGARPGDFRDQTNYVWGVKRLKRLGKSNGTRPNVATPGDIIQFRECRFENAGYTWSYGLPNHTAIVKSVRGSEITLLHQNVDGSLDRSKVREQMIDLAWLKAGSYKIYIAQLK